MKIFLAFHDRIGIANPSAARHVEEDRPESKQREMAPSDIEIKSTVKVFGGQLIRFSHNSVETKTPMVCAVFLPNMTDRLDASSAFPSIVYLSGLTCTDENVCQKGSPYKALVESQVGSRAIRSPNLSPLPAVAALLRFCSPSSLLSFFANWVSDPVAFLRVEC